MAYPIRIGSGLIPSTGEQLRALGLAGSIALVQDSAVAPLYGSAVCASLEAAGYRVHPITVPSGEASKSLDQLSALYLAFSGANLDRGSAVVTLGGGVVGDLGGFAAASYLRGIAFVQDPTTLLAQVDASVGGKTGIDLPAGKNLVGAFHQPRLVLVDLETLATLPEREYVAGLAEVVKYGIIYDARFFEFLEMNQEAIRSHQPDVLEAVIERCCEIKAEVVGEDERESGLRAILNYGHTIGHAVETVAGYGAYLHGEAIAIGMRGANWLSEQAMGLKAEESARIQGLLSSLGLPLRTAQPLPEEDLIQTMLRDKKARSGELRFVLAAEIGRVETRPVPLDLARRALSVIV
jgi:3-dehydroquinate synthase